MAWIILFAAAWLAALLLVPPDNFKRLWPAGIIGMLMLYFIDTTLIRLGAFSYSYGSSILAGIPVFFWTSSFPGGLLLVNYYPAVKRLRLLYVAGSAAVFLAMELVMIRLGYMSYLNWNPFYSYFLNMGGFIIVLWLSRLIGAAGKNKSPLEGDL